MTSKYGMEIGDRYYPNKTFEEFCGIKGRKEIVSLGCLYFHVKYNKRLFSFIEIDSYSGLVQPTEEFINGARVMKEISVDEIIGLVDKLKKELTASRQLVYYERYYGDEMSDKIGRFPSFTNFEFCGYDIISGYGCVSLITSCGDINIKHVDKLNQYGLFSRIEDALYAQEKIAEEDLDADATDTVIYGIWRYIKKD